MSSSVPAPQSPAPQKGELHQLAVRALWGISLGLTVLFVAETVIELLSQDIPWRDLHSSPASGKALASTVSRAFNNLLAMVLSFVAIAIPITANMYTPKLIEIFFADRINLGCLVFFASMGAHAIFGQWLMFDQWTPSTSLAVLWTSGVVGFAVVIPYYLYVLEFLNPTTIIRRVRDRVSEAFPAAASGPAEARRLHDRILQLGNVILRAIDRADRDVAINAIEALESVILAYSAAKPRATARWFDIDKDLFPGLATEAIALLRREKNWVEHACLKQLDLAYVASLSRMPDAVSAISQVNRRIAIHALRTGDDATLGLAIRFFNTFIRASIGKRDAHAVFDVFRQYRGLAIEMLSARPNRSREILRHIRYYAGLARVQGLAFVYELAAADVASVVEAAYAAKTATASDQLAELREFRISEGTVRLVKAAVTLAAWLRSAGFAAEADLVRADALRTRVEDLEAARRDVSTTDDPIFWEVTDRQANLDYLPPDRRARVVAMLDEMIAEKRAAAPPAA